MQFKVWYHFSTPHYLTLPLCVKRFTYFTHYSCRSLQSASHHHQRQRKIVPSSQINLLDVIVYHQLFYITKVFSRAAEGCSNTTLSQTGFRDHTTELKLNIITFIHQQCNGNQPKNYNIFKHLETNQLIHSRYRFQCCWHIKSPGKGKSSLLPYLFKIIYFDTPAKFSGEYRWS